jgi:hypothetical protein
MLYKKVLSEFFEIDESKIAIWYDRFSEFSSYLKKTFKQDKSLSMQEAFTLYLVSKLYGVESVAELGVRYGISSRFWLSTLPDCSVTGYDIKKLYNKRKKLKPITSPKFHFIHGDVNETWKDSKYDLIFYDAHPYDITYKIAYNNIDKVKIHCFHDVGELCFKKESSNIPTDQRVEIDIAGHWERHVMAELFTPNIADDIIAIDDEWRSLIIDDKYGVGITIHNSLIGT